MTWKLPRRVLAIAALVMTGCSSRVPNECTFEIRLLDGGSTSGVAGCGHKSPYDCAAERADGGETAEWKVNCQR